MRSHFARLALLALGATVAACTLNVHHDSQDLEASYDQDDWSVLRIAPDPVQHLTVYAHGLPQVDATLTVETLTDFDTGTRADLAEGLGLVFETSEPDLLQLYPTVPSGADALGLVELQVDVPRPTALDLVIGATNVTVVGTCGPLTLEGGAGDVVVETLGPIGIELGSGNVIALAEFGSIRTGSGDINADLLGVAVLEANAGNIVASLGSGGLLSTGSGDVDVEITNPDFGSLTVSTGSGDVVIELPAGAAPILELRTGTGDVTFPDELETFFAAGDLDPATVALNGHIIVETGSGDVRIEY